MMGDSSCVLYEKEDVSIQQSPSESISGTLSLTLQCRGTTGYIQWKVMPYDSITGAVTPDSKMDYTFVVGLDDLRSVAKHSSLGHSRVSIQTFDGISMPNLHFHSGGAPEFIKAIGSVMSLTEDDNVPNKHTVRPDPNNMLKVFNEKVPIPTRRDSNSAPPEIRNDDSPGVFIESMSFLTRGTRNFIMGAGNAKALNFLKPQKRTRKKVIKTEESQDDDFVVVETEESPTKPDIIVPEPETQSSVTREEWEGFFDGEGRISKDNLSKVRERMCFGGCEEDVRAEIWQHLLEIYPMESTQKDRDRINHTKRSEYLAIRGQWESILPKQAQRFGAFRELRMQIAKDVLRTDRTCPEFKDSNSPGLRRLNSLLTTYSFYNFDLGYVQGMSDILATILPLYHDDCHAFWVFCAIIDRVERHFDEDQKGMFDQLERVSDIIRLTKPALHLKLERLDSSHYLFVFRWVILLMKRELSTSQTKRLWDTLFSSHLAHDYIVFVVAAALHYAEEEIMKSKAFDEVLRCVNDVSENFDLDHILRLSQVLYHSVRQLAEEGDPSYAIFQATKPLSSLDVSKYVVDDSENVCKSMPTC